MQVDAKLHHSPVMGFFVAFRIGLRASALFECFIESGDGSTNLIKSDQKSQEPLGLRSSNLYQVVSSILK